jgi:hypothetical protein
MEASKSRWAAIFVLDWNGRRVDTLQLDERGRHVKSLRSKRQPSRNLTALFHDLEQPPGHSEPVVCPPSQLPPCPPLSDFPMPFPETVFSTFSLQAVKDGKPSVKDQ